MLKTETRERGVGRGRKSVGDKGNDAAGCWRRYVVLMCAAGAPCKLSGPVMCGLGMKGKGRRGGLIQREDGVSGRICCDDRGSGTRLLSPNVPRHGRAARSRLPRCPDIARATAQQQLIASRSSMRSTCAVACIKENASPKACAQPEFPRGGHGEVVRGAAREAQKSLTRLLIAWWL